jgi:aminopeptidase N
MENWGLITYRTTAVLFDEKESDQKYKQRVAYVVSHELAHQWFGNLVTMDWWNEVMWPYSIKFSSLTLSSYGSMKGLPLG